MRLHGPAEPRSTAPGFPAARTGEEGRPAGRGGAAEGSSELRSRLRRAGGHTGLAGRKGRGEKAVGGAVASRGRGREGGGRGSDFPKSPRGGPTPLWRRWLTRLDVGAGSWGPVPIGAGIARP